MSTHLRGPALDNKGREGMDGKGISREGKKRPGEKGVKMTGRKMGGRKMTGRKLGGRKMTGRKMGRRLYVQLDLLVRLLLVALAGPNVVRSFHMHLLLRGCPLPFLQPGLPACPGLFLAR